MLANFDMATFELDFANVTLRQHPTDTDYLQIVAKGTDTTKKLHLDGFSCDHVSESETFRGRQNILYLQTKGVTAGKIYIQAYRTGGYDTVAAAVGVVGAAGSAYFDILQGGDITFISGKKFLSDVTIDDAKVLQWSDVNLKRVGADILGTDDIFAILNYDGASEGGEIQLASPLGWDNKSSAKPNWYIDVFAGTLRLRAYDGTTAKTPLAVDYPNDRIDIHNVSVSGVAGVDGSFTTADVPALTVTVTKGIITSIA